MDSLITEAFKIFFYRSAQAPDLANVQEEEEEEVEEYCPDNNNNNESHISFEVIC